MRIAEAEGGARGKGSRIGDGNRGVGVGEEVKGREIGGEM